MKTILIILFVVMAYHGYAQNPSDSFWKDRSRLNPDTLIRPLNADSIFALYNPWYKYRKKRDFSEDHRIPLNERDTSPRSWFPFNSAEQQRWIREKKMADSMARESQKRFEQSAAEYDKWAKRSDKRGYGGWRYVSFFNYPAYYVKIKTLFTPSLYLRFDSLCQPFLQQHADQDLSRLSSGFQDLYYQHDRFNDICFKFNQVIRYLSSIYNVLTCSRENRDKCLLREMNTLAFIDINFRLFFGEVSREEKQEFLLEEDDWFRTAQKDRINYLKTFLISRDSAKAGAIPFEEIFAGFSAFRPYKEKADSLYLLVKDTLLVYCNNRLIAYEDSIAFYQYVEHRFWTNQKITQDTLAILGPKMNGLLTQRKSLQKDSAQLKASHLSLHNKLAALNDLKARQQKKREEINAIQFHCPAGDEIDHCKHVEAKTNYYRRLKTAREAYYLLSEKISAEMTEYFSGLETWEEKRSDYYKRLSEFNTVYAQIAGKISLLQAKLAAFMQVRQEINDHNIPHVRSTVTRFQSFRSTLTGYMGSPKNMSQPCSDDLVPPYFDVPSYYETERLPYPINQ